MIESVFGDIETRFGVILKKIAASDILDEQDFFDLIVFVASLYTRNPKTMDWQGLSDRLQDMYRMVDRSTNGAEASSDEAWKGSNEAGKLSAIDNAKELAQAIAPHAFIAINVTDIEFFTSDRPAVLDFVQAGYLENFGFPANTIQAESAFWPRARFFYAPLTPRLALISCPLLTLRLADKWEIMDEKLAHALNELSRQNADEWIIANTEQPYPRFYLCISMGGDMLREQHESNRTGIEFTTDDSEFWLTTATMLQFNQSMGYVFKTTDMEVLRRAAAADDLCEAKFYKDGRELESMRNPRFDRVALTPDSESVLGFFLAGKLFSPPGGTARTHDEAPT